MKQSIDYITHGTCSRMIHVVLNDGYVESVRFESGCAGNTKGVAALAVGMKAEEAIERLSGIRCGFKNTSCPDQLAKAIALCLKEEPVNS
ncbi:MAG: TIGR03905 family TSCPD domain-containing protein [Clostridia bacterium]|nr:TIGR03905 family TSCPD domain-containing protein [Clostridia bacterium]